MNDKYEPYWVMHNLSSVPVDSVPACGQCGGKMVVDDECDIVGDWVMKQIFISELGNEAVRELDELGLFEFAMDICHCQICDTNDDGDVYAYYPLANVRWYWDSEKFCEGVLELPAEQRKRKHTEYLKQQIDAGQMTLTFPERVNTDDEHTTG